MFDQPAADHRPNSGSDCTKPRPSADGASAFVLRKRAANDCETTRNQQRCTKPLHCARRDQLAYIRSETAPRGCEREKRYANDENAAASVVISERSADKKKCGKQ